MDGLRKVSMLILLGTLVLAPVGCASTEDYTVHSDQVPDTTSHDDQSHGWGASVQNTTR
jgi:hypothetical protein